MLRASVWCSGVMQCDAVCCTLLHCVALCCSVLLHLEHVENMVGIHLASE